ncbi:MAG: glycosyltransferase family 4 protein [Kangiella sp.]|nr:glycosyltransferase family 4 protein [Kangiella sp.]
MTVTFPSVTQTFVYREIAYLKSQPDFTDLKIYAYQKPTANDLKHANNDLVKECEYFKSNIFMNLISLLKYIIIRPLKVAQVLKEWFSETKRLDLHTNMQLIVHLLTAFGVANKAEKDRIEHIHAHFSTASTVAMFVSILTGCSFSFTAHASGDIYLYSPFLFRKIDLANRIVSISEYNKQYLELISNYSVDENKIIIVTNGIEIPQKLVRKHNNNIPILFMSASFTEIKGYGTLMKALSLLKKKGIKYKFISVGGGSLFDKISLMAKQYGLENEVELLGTQSFSVVQSNLENADIFVFSAEIGLNGARDGMPTAISEAMGYGLPVVATRVTAIPEQVMHRKNGFLANERDVHGIAEYLQKLIEDKSLRETMGAASFKIACEKFDKTNTLENLANVYRNID